MPEPAPTTTVLLESLLDPANQGAWRDFDARYRPVLISFARGLGLSEDEAADVAQQTMAEFVRDYRAGKYERGRGRLSSWIIGIARNRAMDVRRAASRRAGWRGESAMLDLSDAARLTRDWEEARRRVIYEEALVRLRSGTRLDERTIKAFELAVLRGMPTEQVAAECGMSADEVYVAKNRATKRLRQIVEDLTGAYEDEG